MSGFQYRRVGEERMDAGDLDVRLHREALKGLARINRASGAARAMAGVISEMARRRGVTRLRVLDVACGGGDVPVEVAGELKKLGIEVELTLMDRSGTALEEAQGRAEEAGVAARCLLGEAPGKLPEGMFDVVTNSLFLHHLSEEGAVATLAAMRERACARAGGMVVVSDLRRCAMGWWVAWVGCRVLSGSAVVRYDGPVSVAAAYSLEEMEGLAKRAGLAGARVRREWPFRMLLTWERA